MRPIETLLMELLDTPEAELRLKHIGNDVWLIAHFDGAHTSRHVGTKHAVYSMLLDLRAEDIRRKR